MTTENTCPNCRLEGEMNQYGFVCPHCNYMVGSTRNAVIYEDGRGNKRVYYYWVGLEEFPSAPDNTYERVGIETLGG